MPPEVQITGPLRPARFQQRPNRFLLRCHLEGDDGKLLEVVEAHLADPGRLRELLLPGVRVWLRPASGASGAHGAHGAHGARGAHRRTRWSAVLVETPDGRELVSVDTTLPNRLIRVALEADALPELAAWRLHTAEWRHGRSRFDFLLESRTGSDRLVLEVKSVTLVQDGVALFPDAVTARGARHVRELTELAGQPGWHAAILFVLQRPDARRIVAARSIDSVFAEALEEAEAAGVRVLGRRCRVGLCGVTLGDPVPAAAG